MSGKNVNYEDIYTEGITKISSADFKYAKQMNKSIKLLALSRDTEDGFFAMVAPFLLEQENLLLLSYYIEKKKQLLVKLLLMERMFLRLKIVRFLILEEISELSFKTLDFYQKRLFLKTLLLL